LNSPKKLKFLVVDDDRQLLKLMGRLLEARGHEVVLSHAGVNAVIEVPEEHPDCVVTDWVMLGLNGLDLIKELRAGDGCDGIKMIMVTSRLDAESEAEARAAGADGYIRKPIDPANFAETVEKMALDG